MNAIDIGEVEEVINIEPIKEPALVPIEEEEREAVPA